MTIQSVALFRFLQGVNGAWPSGCCPPVWAELRHSERFAHRQDKRRPLVADYVTPVITPRYAVVDPEERCTSSRAEEARSFSQKSSLCEFFCEKDKKCTMRPQTVCVSSGETLSLNAHHVTRVINETVIVPRLLFINRSALHIKLTLHAHLVISYGGSRI